MDPIIALKHLFTPKIKIIFEQKCKLIFILIISTEIIWMNSCSEAASSTKLWKSKEGHETGSLLWKGVNRTNVNDPSMYPEARNGIAVLEKHGIRSARVNQSTNKHARYFLPNVTTSELLNSNETESSFDTDAKANLSSTVTAAQNLSTNMSWVESNVSESQTRGYNNVSAEAEVTTKVYRMHENITTIEALQNNLISDIRPFVVIDVDNNNLSKSLGSYAFHRRQVIDHKRGRQNVYDVNQLPQNISEENHLKHLKNGKLSNILHARDLRIIPEDLNNNYMDTHLNNFNKLLIPLSRSRTDAREINHAFSQQMNSKVEQVKREDNLFNKGNIFMPDINFPGGKDSSLKKYKMKFQPFPQKTNFIFKDVPESFINKPKSPFIDNLIQNKQMHIKRDQFIEPRELMNINKNDFNGKHKIPLLPIQYMNKKPNSEILPGSPNNIPPVEINYFMIKIPHSPVKTPNYGIFPPVAKNYQVKTELPFLKITEENKDEKPHHMNENINKYAKEMRIKGPPSEFVEFVRPELYVAPPEHTKLSPYAKNQMQKRSQEKSLKNYGNYTVSGKEHSKNHNGREASMNKTENKYIRHESSPFTRELRMDNNKSINKINIHKIQTNHSNPIERMNNKSRRVTSREMHKNSPSESHTGQVSNNNGSHNFPVTHINYLQSDPKTAHINIQTAVSGMPRLSPKAILRNEYVNNVTPLEFTTKEFTEEVLNEGEIHNAQQMPPGESVKPVLYRVPHKKTDRRFEKDLNSNNEAYDKQYMKEKEPYEQELKNKINGFPAEFASWELNRNGINQFSPYGQYLKAKEPATQDLSGYRTNAFSRNEKVQPSPEFYNQSKDINNRKQREKGPPIFSIKEGENAQIFQPLTNEQEIYPQNENFPFVTKSVNDELHMKMSPVKEFDSSMNPFDVTNIEDVQKFFQLDGETTVSIEDQKQTMPMDIHLMNNQNPMRQIGEISNDGGKQEQIQTKETLFGSPHGKKIDNKDNNFASLQPEIQAKIRSLENLPFDAKGIGDSLNQFAINKIAEPQTNTEYTRRMEPRENVASFKKYGNEIGIKPHTMELSTNRIDVVKEIDTINRKTEIESIQIQKEIPLTNKAIESNPPQSKKFSFHGFDSDESIQPPSTKSEKLLPSGNKYIQAYPPPIAEKPLPFDDKYIQAYSYSPIAEKPLPFDDKYMQTYSPIAEKPLPFDDKYAYAYSPKEKPSMFDGNYNVPAMERNTVPFYGIYTQLPKRVNNMDLYANYQPKSSEQFTVRPFSNYPVNTIPSNNEIENLNLPEALQSFMNMKNKENLNDVTVEYKTARYEVVPELINFQITVDPYKEYLMNNQEDIRQNGENVTSPVKKIIKISEKEIEIFSPKKTDGVKEISRLEQMLRNDDDEVNDISDNYANIKKRRENNEFQPNSDLVSHTSPQIQTENEQNIYNETEKVPEDSDLLTNSRFNTNTMRKPLALSYLSDDGDQVKNSSTGVKQRQTISSKLFTLSLKPLMKIHQRTFSELLAQTYSDKVLNLSNSSEHVSKAKDGHIQFSFENATTRNASGILSTKIKLFIGSFDKLFRLLKKSMGCTLLVAVTGGMITVSIFIIFVFANSYNNQNRIFRVYNIDSQVSGAERSYFPNRFDRDESFAKSIRRYFRMLPHRLFMAKLPDDSRMQFHI